MYSRGALWWGAMNLIVVIRLMRDRDGPNRRLHYSQSHSAGKRVGRTGRQSPGRRHNADLRSAPLPFASSANLFEESLCPYVRPLTRHKAKVTAAGKNSEFAFGHLAFQVCEFPGIV